MRESSLNVTLDIVIDGLKVKRSCFRRQPLNAEILKKEFGNQSMDLIVQLTTSTPQKFRFSVNHLPTEIDIEKVKIKVSLTIFFF